MRKRGSPFAGERGRRAPRDEPSDGGGTRNRGAEEQVQGGGETTGRRGAGGGPGAVGPGEAVAAEAPGPAPGDGPRAVAAEEAEEGVPVEPEPEERERALGEQLLRLAAEFDNYRKREIRERAEAWGRAKADLIEKLLAPIDDLSRVAHPEAAAGPLDPQAASLLAGIELVERKMLQTLEREGLQRIDAEGAEFDPAVHDAILTQLTDDPALDGRVAHVALPGYRFADRLLRPAKVVVWKRAG
jgi:molecular chaperone GrpE